MNKNKCTQETIGIIVKRKKGPEVSHTTVEYFVDGVAYKVTEQDRYNEVEVIKFFFIPIGLKGTSKALGKVGDVARVRYNPKKPKQAYLPENVGRRF